MKARVLMTLVAVWSLGADLPEDEKSKKATDALQGEWVIEMAAYGPVKDSMKELNGQKWTIKGDRFESPIIKSRFEVDSSKPTATIDFYENGMLVTRGIYTLDGDTLTFCLGGTHVHYDNLAIDSPTKKEADDRPMKFDPMQGLLLVMKKAR